MKFDILNYLKHGRYKPKNLIESLFAQFFKSTWDQIYF